MTPLLELPNQRSIGHAEDRAFEFRHHIVGHPLLELGALAELADALPAIDIEHNLGDVPVHNPGGAAPRLDDSPGAIVRGIETNGCWMALKQIERNASYQQFVYDIADELATGITRGAGRARDRQGWIFLAAARATTPLHIDTEHGFLLQIRGEKSVCIAPRPETAPEQLELERIYANGHRNLETMPTEWQTFHLTPGDGVHVPVWAPHWVENGPDVSIALSVTFRTRAVVRAGRVHKVNAQLRQRGWEPTAPGERVPADLTKAAVQRIQASPEKSKHLGWVLRARLSRLRSRIRERLSPSRA